MKKTRARKASSSARTQPPPLEVRALRPTNWPALEALFGACGGCWCMAWRLERAAWEAGRGQLASRRTCLTDCAPTDCPNIVI
ncbi:MAG: hypothetical protein EXS08_13550 [Planctomycetes bacterium]|nr:hypothetical protein [Planctomycetota bacterium]